MALACATLVAPLASLVGLLVATWLVLLNNYAPVYPFKVMGTGFPCYIALAALVLNIVVSTVLSLVFNAVAPDRDNDVTVASDYV